MTSTIIMPNDAMLSVPIPPAYIGKQIEVTFALIDETSKIKLSDMFRGVSSKENDYDFFYSVSEQVLAKDWLNKYEDEAWRNL
jgi:ADP-glucose pyrophosphorylase